MYGATIRCNAPGCSACVRGEGISQAAANMDAQVNARFENWAVAPDRGVADEDYCRKHWDMALWLRFPPGLRK